MPGSGLRLGPEPAENHALTPAPTSAGRLAPTPVQSTSSVTQLTWAEGVPRQHSDTSREEVVCDIFAKMCDHTLAILAGGGL